jgi:hypothetical protein
MKVRRKDWEALQAKLTRLEADVREARRGTLMDTKTGLVLTSVVVPAILRHLKVESRHGHWDLLPASESDGIKT